MTKKEAKEQYLLDRIGWRDDKTITGFTLSAQNLLSNSGLYFQSEHSVVTLLNIKECQPIVGISDADFNAHLRFMSDQVVTQVLFDALERDFIDEDILIAYPDAFDEAISLRMVISVSELILTSTRSNRVKRISDETAAKLNYDIFREAPNKFAIRGVNYKHTLGVATRYGFALRSIQRRFGQQRNQLKTITRGQVINNELYE